LGSTLAIRAFGLASSLAVDFAAIRYSDEKATTLALVEDESGKRR
jgi:hypothetical protein